MMIGMNEMDKMDRRSRAIMDSFFHYTGLEWYTKFTRVMAVGMGRQFLLNTANKPDFNATHERWLAELGLTKDEVLAWNAQNQDFSTPHGEKVRDAIARFADEAIIRPDATQRPTWSNSPYFQMVWALKSYYFGFGKTVIGGMVREIRNRYSETGDFAGAAGPLVLAATTLIPLAMLSMASREWARWLLQLALPGVPETPLRSQHLDMPSYFYEVFKRTGVLGPAMIPLATAEAFKFEGIAAPLTSNIPMFDMFDDTFFDHDYLRPIPILNNIQK